MLPIRVRSVPAAAVDGVTGVEVAPEAHHVGVTGQEHAAIVHHDRVVTSPLHQPYPVGKYNSRISNPINQMELVWLL